MAAKQKAKQEPADEDADFAEYLAKIKSEAEAFLDAKAAEAKERYPNIPLDWHRAQLIERSGFLGCSCMSVIAYVERKK